jgi:hypothetical protein
MGISAMPLRRHRTATSAAFDPANSVFLAEARFGDICRFTHAQSPLFFL